MLQRDPSQQELLLTRRLRGDLFLRSPFTRGRMERAGIGRRGIKSLDDLRRLPPMRLDDVSVARTLLTVPPGLAKPAPRGVSARIRHRIETKRYAPVRWSGGADTPLAYSADDLELLAHLGRELLAMAGLSPNDVLVSLLDGVEARDRWQIESGAAALGTSLVALPKGSAWSTVRRLDPSAITGTAGELKEVLEEAAGDARVNRLHTAVLVGGADGALLEALKQLCGEAIVLTQAWAPPGVLALWGQCRKGVGFHTWPPYEAIEMVDALTHIPKPVIDDEVSAGLVLWTGSGWFASAIVRLDTDVAAGLDARVCPTCGRSSPRLVPAAAELTFVDVLDNDPDIASWVAELHRKNGNDQLMMSVVPENVQSSLLVIESIDRRIGSTNVVLVSEDVVARHLEAANGERYVDRRAARDYE